mmetsp:Transcript_18775/g.61664  ORF Transcript_18775/g.61664 Transcript_18775/m.61664 type:complete len:321 (-) Transcript_18775:3163-4125(-)
MRNQLGIRPSRILDELRMSSLLHHTPLAEHHDVVRVLDGGKAMRYDDDRSPNHEVFQRLLHDLLALRVKRGSSLIQQQDVRVRDHGPCNRDPLLLSAAELSSSLSALRLEVAGQVHDEVVRVGALGGFINFFLASILPSIEDVLVDGGSEQHRLLADKPQVRAQPTQVERLDVLAIQQHLPLVWFVETLDQGDNRALATARAADKCHCLTGVDGQVEAAEDLSFGSSRVREMNVPQLNVALHRGRPLSALVLNVNLGYPINQLEDSNERWLAFGNVRSEGPCHASRHAHEGDGEEHLQHILEGVIIMIHEVSPSRKTAVI